MSMVKFMAVVDWKEMCADDLRKMKEEIECEMNRRELVCTELYAKYGDVIEREYRANGRVITILGAQASSVENLGE
jgi:hypothetical protein